MTRASIFGERVDRRLHYSDLVSVRADRYQLPCNHPLLPPDIDGLREHWKSDQSTAMVVSLQQQQSRQQLLLFAAAAADSIAPISTIRTRTYGCNCAGIKRVVGDVRYSLSITPTRSSITSAAPNSPMDAPNCIGHTSEIAFFCGLSIVTLALALRCAAQSLSLELPLLVQTIQDANAPFSISSSNYPPPPSSCYFFFFLPITSCVRVPAAAPATKLAFYLETYCSSYS